MPGQGIKKPIMVESLPVDIEDGQSYYISQKSPNTLTHIFFKYPCRFIPEIPRWALKRYVGDNKNAIVFDPFSGSGTTLLESIINGYSSCGTEIDEIAKLLIKVKTTPLTKEELDYTKTYFEKITLKTGDDKVSVSRPQISNLEHWFSEEAITILGRLLTLIDKAKYQNVKDFMKICLVSVIKKVSYADDISPKPYVSTKIIKRPPNALDEFKSVYSKYFDAMSEFSNSGISKTTRILEGDALNFRIDSRADLAITSPPYINAFDYARVMRLENLWLGALTEDELKNKKKKYVGTEQVNVINEEKDLSILNESSLLKKVFDEVYLVDKKRAMIIKKFFADIKNNLQCVYDNLNDNCCYMIVIGDSKIRSVEIQSWKIILEIAKNIGYTKDVHFSYVIQNPYIRIPRGNKGGKINSDQVLVLKKEVK